MAEVKIKSAFVEDNKGFVLKIAEPHSRKDESGKYQTVARTFFDVKVSRDSGIDLSLFAKGDRVTVSGSQKTEVREHEGKKYYSLVVWADSIGHAQPSQGGSGAVSQTQWASAPPAHENGSQGGFGDGDFGSPF